MGPSKNTLLTPWCPKLVTGLLVFRGSMRLSNGTWGGYRALWDSLQTITRVEIVYEDNISLFETGRVDLIDPVNSFNYICTKFFTGAYDSKKVIYN